MASGSLALLDLRPRAVSRYGTRAQIAAHDGQVEGYLTLADCDTRTHTATYALRIDNGSAAALRARMTCVRLRGDIVPAYPMDVTVAPFSRCETLLPVRMDQVGPYDRAVVSVEGAQIAFTIEAPAPVSRRAKLPWPAAVVSGIAFTVAASLGAAAATPRIAMLAAPSRVLAGEPVEIPYAFGGWASMQYALKTKDGRQLSAGLISTHEGTLRFKVPQTAGNAMVLSVNVAGPFGVRSANQDIDISGNTAPKPVAAKASPQAPRIAEFALTSPTVHAGAPAEFAYTTNAQDGQIWLIDEAGRLWANAPISADGHTRIDVPQAAAGRSVRAVMRVRSAAQDAVASVAFTVLPGAVAAQEPAIEKAPSKTPARIAAPAAVPATLSLSSSSASPGETITVSIGGAHGDSTVVLNDTSGNSVDTGDIAEGQSAIVLTAPSSAGTYYVLATVSQGVSSQTLVQKLIVR